MPEMALLINAEIVEYPKTDNETFSQQHKYVYICMYVHAYVNI